jgi:hypothetical protein
MHNSMAEIVVAALLDLHLTHGPVRGGIPIERDRLHSSVCSARALKSLARSTNRFVDRYLHHSPRTGVRHQPL